tara:strand:- start:604 stop:852 length:249 start_codon:yes stop_codon:yes gene_type:complete
MSVERDGIAVFAGSTTISEMKRELQELVDYLFRETSFASGVFLMTGTGIVPGADFTLQVDDLVKITIDGIGELANRVAVARD